MRTTTTLFFLIVSLQTFAQKFIGIKCGVNTSFFSASGVGKSYPGPALGIIYRNSDTISLLLEICYKRKSNDFTFDYYSHADLGHTSGKFDVDYITADVCAGAAFGNKIKWYFFGGLFAGV